MLFLVHAFELFISFVRNVYSYDVENQEYDSKTQIKSETSSSSLNLSLSLTGRLSLCGSCLHHVTHLSKHCESVYQAENHIHENVAVVKFGKTTVENGA